ncbi:LuxE/PaaK family acyltransferase [Costertonia aggregata]|uniref:Acyl transferase n=1 Tax=Costertonia aggregata TaxID=343403 RepID=A0A7H9AQK1_9FLAO|nr:acyl transferase [Costertonia aggregata]QLG45692.1 acyl transferase [Costertonia aggregata]
MGLQELTSAIFRIDTSTELESVALKVFAHQFKNNIVYQNFCTYLGKDEPHVKSVDDIPFLPIQFFKSHNVVCGATEPDAIFSSSGTTGSLTSKHCVSDVTIYQESYLKAFHTFYGNISDFCILALLPSYLERKGSSLIYMVNDLIKKSHHPDSGFYLNDLKSLHIKLKALDASGTKTILIGVSFALLDLAEIYPMKLKHTIVMETGGMKGRRKEMISEELHSVLCKGFGVNKIHSEYGMTELLSQAYSKGNGIFYTPPWMKIIIRDTEDPLTDQGYGKTGGLNIIDLANVNSCSFIATQDLGKTYEDESFKVMGRFDNSDIRGCNLMVL